MSIRSEGIINSLKVSSEGGLFLIKIIIEMVTKNLNNGINLRLTYVGNQPMSGASTVCR